MSRPPVPVVLVAGYLGSGKTTLLNHLLRAASASGTRIGVLVNDFGAVNIDALLVAGQADGSVSLGNGCMCCTVDAGDLAETLIGLLRPSAGLDAIIIEASGIAEPKALIRMVTAIDDPRMRYGGLAYVVDAAAFDEVRERHREVDGHVAIADLVVVNKSDLVDAGRLDAVRRVVETLNPTAPSLSTVEAAVDPEMLFDVVRRDDAGVAVARQLTLDALLVDDADTHAHLHADYDSVTFTSTEPMDPRSLATFLERPPDGCYRIKGFAHFDVPGHRQKFEVHAVGGFVRVVRHRWAGDTPSTTLVAIGSGLDATEVRKRLTEAIADPDIDDEHGILGIIRHVTGP